MMISTNINFVFLITVLVLHFLNDRNILIEESKVKQKIIKRQNGLIQRQRRQIEFLNSQLPTNDIVKDDC